MSEKPTRKRNRPTVVCSNCRAKKTKCDRKFPCSCCLKAGIADTCNLGTKKDSANGEQASSGTVVSNPAYKNPILNPVVDGTFGCEAIPIPRGVGAFNSGAIGNNINNNISNIGSNIGSSSLIGNDPVVQNQLEFLKNKLRALEASITVASLHKPSFSSYTSPRRHHLHRC